MIRFAKAFGEILLILANFYTLVIVFAMFQSYVEGSIKLNTGAKILFGTWLLSVVVVATSQFFLLACRPKDIQKWKNRRRIEKD